MKRLLLIEDDLLAADIYRNRLAKAGFEVALAPDGQTGIEMVDSFMPDVIILDLILPKMTGVEVLKHIRAQDKTKHIPVVVLTNAYLSEMVSEAWRAGATKCLSKVNCTPKHVVEVVLGLFPDEGQKQTAQILSVPVTPVTPAAPLPQTPVRETKVADADEQFVRELRNQFASELPGVLTGLRTHLQALVKSDTQAKQVSHLHGLQRQLHALSGNAGLAGLIQIAQLSAALEALVKEMHERPVNINASTLRTVALGIDFLAVLFARAVKDGTTDLPPATALVVDDEAISRRAIVYALEKAKLKCAVAENGETALKLLGQSKFDLIVLDIDMPDMTGFELCGRIRTLPAYASTPVVFVTSLNDFESRANSTISGGTDLIAKPFLFVELAVKALVYVMRSRLSSSAK